MVGLKESISMILRQLNILATTSVTTMEIYDRKSQRAFISHLRNNRKHITPSSLRAYWRRYGGEVAGADFDPNLLWGQNATRYIKILGRLQLRRNEPYRRKLAEIPIRKPGTDHGNR